MFETGVICGECKLNVPTATTVILTAPVVREGKTYPGQATETARRVCVSCRAMLAQQADPEPKVMEWTFEMEYEFNGRTRVATKSLTLPAAKTEHQALIHMIQSFTRDHVAEVELLSVVLVNSRAY